MFRTLTFIPELCSHVIPRIAASRSAGRHSQAVYCAQPCACTYLETCNSIRSFVSRSHEKLVGSLVAFSRKSIWLMIPRCRQYLTATTWRRRPTAPRVYSSTENSTIFPWELPRKLAPVRTNPSAATTIVDSWYK